MQGTPKSTTPTAALSHCSHRWAEKTTYSMLGGSPTGWAQRVEIGRHRGYGPEFTGESGPYDQVLAARRDRHPGGARLSAQCP